MESFDVQFLFAFIGNSLLFVVGKLIWGKGILKPAAFMWLLSAGIFFLTLI